MQRWVEIEIAARGDEQEIVGAALTEQAGCRGYTATEIAVLGYLPVDERVEEALLSLKAVLGRKELTLRFVNEEDWAHAWKQYFKPQQIGERMVIKPTWEEYAPRAGDIIIEIDPGMAFGTGLHATTRLCLRSLEKHVQPSDSVADVGTGSGILAIAAAKLGAAWVIATDNDPLAVKIALENVALNGEGERVTVVESATPPEGTFAIVVANILADVILGMKDALYAAVRPGGLLIASGIIEERARDVEQGLVAAGFTVTATHHEGEWVVIEAQRC
jgi:ribosomal protein L11 methyltransferase